MEKIYKIYWNNILIGTSKLEKADAPMGVVMGKIDFLDTNFGYKTIKEYCQSNGIELAIDDEPHRAISTMHIPQLKVLNDKGIEIKGVGNQIEGMDGELYEISIYGIAYPFYEEEFPHHVKDYEERNYRQ